MTTVTMSSGMEAHLRHLTDRALAESRESFDRAMSRTMTQPMPALSKTTSFRITTPTDGIREFTLSVTLVELADGTTSPTPGFDRRGG